jgi:hypothetical protein
MLKTLVVAGGFNDSKLSSIAYGLRIGRLDIPSPEIDK